MMKDVQRAFGRLFLTVAQLYKGPVYKMSHEMTANHQAVIYVLL